MGITTNMKRRQKQHSEGLSRTTNRYNKSYKLQEIRYKEIINLNDEMTFKKLSTRTKLNKSKNWVRWTGEYIKFIY